MLIFLPAGLLLGGWTLPSALNGVERITLATFLNGEWTLPFEKKFTEELAVYKPSRAFWGTAEYTLFGDGRSGVVIGKDGWLFTSEEFQTSRKSPEIYAGHMAYIEDTAKALSEKGVRLVVALLPAKAGLHQDLLGDARYPASKQSIYADTFRSLSEKQIEVVDLAGAFKGHESAFLKTDTHWSQEGAELAAAAIAAGVRKTCPDCVPAPVEYKTAPAGDVAAHDGDLLRYVPLTEDMKKSLMQDRIGTLETQAVEPAAGGGNSEADLFGESQVSIVLVGTSYSANPLFNFVGFLKERIGSDVLNAADEGQGPFVTMKKWRSEMLTEGAALPKLVIWEIPERYLTIADTSGKPKTE